LCAGGSGCVAGWVRRSREQVGGCLACFGAPVIAGLLAGTSALVVGDRWRLVSAGGGG